MIDPLLEILPSSITDAFESNCTHSIKPSSYQSDDLYAAALSDHLGHTRLNIGTALATNSGNTGAQVSRIGLGMSIRRCHK